MTAFHTIAIPHADILQGHPDNFIKKQCDSFPAERKLIQGVEKET